jgi:hypothetical protein
MPKPKRRRPKKVTPPEEMINTSEKFEEEKNQETAEIEG